MPLSATPEPTPEPVAREAAEETIEFWEVLSPPVQSVFLRALSRPVRVARVEHVIVALLADLSPEREPWLSAFEPHDQEAGARDARHATARARGLLQKLGVDAIALEQRSLALAQQEPPSDKGTKVSRDFKHVWRMAQSEAGAMGSPHVWPEHLLLAILRWGRPRSSWSVWPLRSDRALQVLEGLKIDLHVARALVRDALSDEIEAPGVFSVQVEKAVAHAHQLCIKTHCGRIAPAHLLLALLRDDEDARDALKYLEVSGVDVEALREDVRKRIQSDGEASTATPRFSKDSARVLDKSKAMARRAGWRVIDEPILMLHLAIHGGESTEALRQVLGGDAGRLQVLAGSLYPKQRARRVVHQGVDYEEWGWPRDTRSQLAFVTPSVSIAGAMLMFWLEPNRRGPFSWGALILAGLVVMLLLRCIGLLLSRPGPFKQECKSFLSGFIFSIFGAMFISIAVSWVVRMIEMYLPNL